MTRVRLDEILRRLPDLSIGVIGDFFLDKYLVIDPALSETSLETGLEARQVVEIRCSPGAAGTVTSNLSALGVGRIEAIGVIGDDGEGFELRRLLEQTRVGTSMLVRRAVRFTPTYGKPMLKEGDTEREMERLDTKNRVPIGSDLEETLLAAVRGLLESQALQAVMIADQVQERNCGVVTDRVRDGLAALARAHPSILFFADSRVRIDEYRDVVVKPNRSEAAAASGGVLSESTPIVQTGCHGMAMAARNRRPVFITLGADGIVACTSDEFIHEPAVPVSGPIDIVGAGDSASAGIVCALSAGASKGEAARLGNLCAGVTVRKLGTTGTASAEEVVRLSEEQPVR